MREAVRAEGSLIVCADWSASHPRILADLSGDMALIDDLVHGDAYAAICGALGLRVSDRRRAVKASVLALLNGEGLRSRWNRLPYTAHRLHGVMEARWPLALNYLRSIVERADADHGRLTTPAGTAVNVPLEKRFAAGGYLLQAIESDALVRAIKLVHGLEDAGYPLQLIMTVHDEIVVECYDPTRVQLVAALLADAMSTATSFRPELQTGAADVTYGPSWGQQDGTTGAARTLPPLPAGVVAPRPEPKAPWAHLLESDCALLCLDQARQRTLKIRQQWYGAGMATRGDDCLARSLHAKSPDEVVSWGMRCRSAVCIYCGPYQYALIEQAILGMPLVDPDGEVLGRPLGGRSLFLYRFPAKQLRGFRIALRKAVARKDRIPSIGPEGSRRNAILSAEAHAYVVVKLPETKEVAVITTVEQVYARKSMPQATTILVARLMVEALLAEGLTPRKKANGTFEVQGRISSSNNLHLDPRAVMTAARGSVWQRTLGPKGASPREVYARAQRMTKMVTVKRDDEGIVESVVTTLQGIKGSFDLFFAALEGGIDIDDDEVERRIQRYLDSCQPAYGEVAPSPKDTEMMMALADALL